jgi:PKD repeat protein
MSLSSCNKQEPEACISIQQRVTTFYVGERVQLQASCSKNAEEYSWSIGKPGKYQTFNAPSVKVQFQEAGSYEVKLRVGNGQSSDVVSLLVQVIPTDSGQ